MIDILTMVDEENQKREPVIENDQKPEQQPTPSPQQEPAASSENDLLLKLEEAQRQADQYKDLFLRKAAEFENYKRRVENEAGTIIKFANEELIGEILPVLDDFERSLNLSKERKEFESFYRGVELIYQKLVKILESQGIKAIETVGKPFDVHYHDALMQMPREDVPAFTILKEVEKGYTLHNKVIRHAKVIVSSSPAEHEPVEPSPQAQQGDQGPDHQSSNGS